MTARRRDETREGRESVTALALARQYLQAASISAGHALEALIWGHPDAREVCSPETLGEARFARYMELTALTLAASRYHHALAFPKKGDDLEALGAALSPGDREQILAAVRDRRDAGAAGVIFPPQFWLTTDAGKTIAEEIAELDEIALVDTERLRPTRLAMLLSREDGSRAPDPWSWLAEHVPGEDTSHLELYFSSALERLAREEAERRATSEEVRAEALAQQLEQQRLPLQLGTHLVLPNALLQSGYASSEMFRRRLRQGEQGELFLPIDAQEVIREAAELTVEQTQLGQMTPHQVRALVGVFRLFSTTGEEKGSFRQGTLPIDARIMYRAAEVDHRNGRACRALFQALDELGHRELRVALKIETANGPALVGDRSPVFRMKPVWLPQADGRKRRSEEDVAAIAQAWAKGRTDLFGGTLPLPDQYIIELPELMQRIFGRMVLTGDILTRLDRGAKTVRGKTEGFSDLDWRLFIEITQRVQPRQPSETGQTLKSFVDRDALLQDLYGREAIQKARRRGDYHRRQVQQYERSVQVLAEAQIAVRVEVGRQTRRGGVRDVFELLPDVVHGLTARAERQLAIQPPLPLPAGPKGRRRRAG